MCQVYNRQQKSSPNPLASAQNISALNGSRVSLQTAMGNSNARWMVLSLCVNVCSMRGKAVSIIEQMTKDCRREDCQLVADGYGVSNEAGSSEGWSCKSCKL